jgi:hypothetical protein
MEILSDPEALDAAAVIDDEYATRNSFPVRL